MSSFYDDASLVVIPSGYKTSKVYAEKPTDGSGDLAFTRTGDTATRVNSAGLIERVRTNLVLQSETFDNASWTKSLDGQVTITANAAVAPNGTTTADKIIPSAIAGFHCVQQQVTLSAGEASISVYAKAAENSFLQFFDALTTDYVNFNLTTGVVGSSDAYVGSIENAGSGWYRCKATKVVPSGTFSARIGVVTSATAARGESFTGNGTNGLLIWGAQLEYGVATPYIPTTTAAVSVGPVANVPRLDYLGSTCPRLLLEPQRTNALLSSEDWTTNWSGSNRSVTANNIVSPDGYQNADKLSATGGSAYYAQVRTTASGANTFSVFLKYGDKTTQSIYAYSSGSYFAQAAFNLQTGTVASTASGTAKIEDYGNGWYRCSVSGTAGSSTIEVGIEGIGVGTYTYAWGAQLEAGYATSYIPTLAASATRGADACSKTGISSLIGQTEGTLYGEIEVSQNGFWYLSLSSGSNTNWVFIGQDLVTNNRIRGYVRSGGVVYADITSGNIANGTYKVAIAYNANDVVMYVNGTLIGSDNSATMPVGLANFYISAASATGGDQTVTGAIKQTLLFKTRLTNAQLAELTTL